jgi:hypothetical protein
LKRGIDKASKAHNIGLMVSTREYAFDSSRACRRLSEFVPVKIQELDESRSRSLISGRLEGRLIQGFSEQLDSVVLNYPEMKRSPLMLCLLIEVYKKKGKIPTRRHLLYQDLVRGLVMSHMSKHDAGKRRSRRLKGSAAEDATKFLAALAFVCHIHLRQRDFEWGSDVVQIKIQEIWQNSSTTLKEMSECLLHSTVGLLSKVGDDKYRFSHLTLQEYLAAKHTCQIYGKDALQLMEQLKPLQPAVSKDGLWNKEVSRFVAGMLAPNVFVDFCQLIIESDEREKERGRKTGKRKGDITGFCCEMVQDFLKERGPSEVVERMLCDQMQKIRSTDLLLAGLCHPCPEIRSSVLSEMIQFRVPPNPFADGTVPKLKEIAADKRAVWHKRAAAMLSLAQIAQMKHCSRSDRAETISWMLKMLQSESSVLENVHFALVKGLGTVLKLGGESAAGGGIMLQHDDESVLFQPGLRGSEPVANALADLKIYSAGLVDWLEGEPEGDPSFIAQRRFITQGRWPIRHVHFLCENAAASNDSQRASRLVNSLLHRLHSSSFQTSEQTLLLRGLHAVHALVAADGWSQVLPFLESGDAEQRARVLAAAGEINVEFEREDAISHLAMCLLSEMGPTSTLQSTRTSLLSYVMKKEADKYRYSSLRERSNVFVFLVNIMGQSTGDSRQVVSQYLIDFEKAHVGEKPERSKAEEKTKQGGKKPAIGKEGKEDSGMQDMQRLLTTNASSIDRHLQEFLPGILDQRNSGTATDVCERYCAASLWTSSGLVQETQAEKIAGWLLLREEEPASVVKAFEDLKHLQEPWMQGREGTDGKWERQVLEALQMGTLGRFIFAMLLQYVREKVMREPSSALEGFTLLSETIRQWDAETDEKRLEQQLLLKELCIGRRNEQLPSWSGVVTRTRIPSGADPRWRRLLEKRQVVPGDEIVYIFNDNYEEVGEVQSDGRIKHSNMRTLDVYYIDPVAFRTKNNAWASTDNQSERDARLALFAEFHKCVGENKIESLEKLLSSCDSIDAPGAASRGGGGGGRSGKDVQGAWNGQCNID